jgi:hypothetical protein
MIQAITGSTWVGNVIAFYKVSCVSQLSLTLFVVNRRHLQTQRRIFDMFISFGMRILKKSEEIIPLSMDGGMM